MRMRGDILMSCLRRKRRLSNGNVEGFGSGAAGGDGRRSEFTMMRDDGFHEPDSSTMSVLQLRQYLSE